MFDPGLWKDNRDGTEFAGDAAPPGDPYVRRIAGESRQAAEVSKATLTSIVSVLESGLARATQPVAYHYPQLCWRYGGACMPPPDGGGRRRWGTAVPCACKARALFALEGNTRTAFPNTRLRLRVPCVCQRAWTKHSTALPRSSVHSGGRWHRVLMAAARTMSRAVLPEPSVDVVARRLGRQYPRNLCTHARRKKHVSP